MLPIRGDGRRLLRLPLLSRALPFAKVRAGDLRQNDRIRTLEEARMRCGVAVIGAGPYGLGAVAHLRGAGIDARIFGQPMSFWRTMPKGMLLRSNWSASNMADPDAGGGLSLTAFQKSTGARFGEPIPLDRFIEYGEWVQKRVAPDVDTRRVRTVDRAGHEFHLTLEDGEVALAERVIVAAGISRFPWRPPEFAALPRALVSHTSELDDPGEFAGSKVAVVGGGQSALEWTALLREAGADVEGVARAPRLAWIRGMKKRLGPLGPILYAPTDVGPLWYSRLVSFPDLFRRLPRGAQDTIAQRCIRPAGAGWLVPRLERASVSLGVSVTRAEPRNGRLALSLDDGTQRRVDHLLLGTGYRIDVRRYEFLGSALLDQVRTVDGYPVLSAGLESSVPGLHFLGAPAAWSFGPIMRFVSGSWYSCREVTRRILAGGPLPQEDEASAVVAGVVSS
jgi:thioredoxin reductase